MPHTVPALFGSLSDKKKGYKKMINNFEEVKTALSQVQKRQRVRLLSPEKIADILDQVESRLKEDNALTAKILVHYDGAEHFPNAYNGTPMSTHFIAVFDGAAWDVKSVSREKCPNRKTLNTTATIPDGSTKRFLIF